MTKHILFFQGAGDEGYEADKELVDSLQKNLGKEYDIDYPKINSDESLPDFGWIKQIENKVAALESDIILVGHSLGASMLLKYLSENPVTQRVKGVFLIATPFWEGNEDWKTGLKLQDDFAYKVPDEIPFFFYHCKDDEEAPFSHLNRYKQKLTQATFREINNGGHQLNNDLTPVANDIKSRYIV
ncbi:alpha/beta fold hydrolase [Runella sp.]|uniref:alpha/beta fold hydrolase n=1 Tax=Runella sp. TaxID=1960881 RepID=UPI003D09EEC3